MSRRGRPKGGGLRPEAARELVLDAAETCFVRYGAEHTTVEQIAAEADISRAMVYKLFDGRDAIVVGVLSRAAERFMARLDVIVQTAPSLGRLIVEGMCEVVRLGRSDPLVHAAFTGEGRGLAQRLVTEDETIRVQARGFHGHVLDHARPELRAELRRGLALEDAADHLVLVGNAMITDTSGRFDDPELVRRHLETFVLPAFVADPVASGTRVPA